MRTEISACRLCSGNCGMVVSIDDAGRVARLRGDRENPFSNGYACIKGLEVPQAMYGPQRVLKPLKRRGDGAFEEIALEQALDEIAGRLKAIMAENGGESVGLFNGTAYYNNAPLVEILGGWLKAIGSHNRYSTLTIDQSAHLVTTARMGSWHAGRQDFESSDVALLVGTNPLVSLGAYFQLSADPMKRLKAAKARGLKLIVIDPRATETAAHADCFLQPIPGQDAAIMAGLIHIVLEQGWQDAVFCSRFVEGLDVIRAAVAPFTPDYVARRAGVSAESLTEAAAMFARDARRGIAITGTGATMAPWSNLTDHLAETLNAICGRYLRAGDKVPNPGVLGRPREFRAEAIPPRRTWESGPTNPLGQGQLGSEFPSSQMADHILFDGPERLRALIVNGANPIACLPNQKRAAKALRSLDLLVTIDPFMTATARICDYILPPRIQYERTDVLFGRRLESSQAHIPFAQFLPALVEPPAGSELTDDWYVYWALAARLGLPLRFAGVDLDMATPPRTEQLLDLLCRGSRVPFEKVRTARRGALFDDEPQLVQDAAPDATARLQLAPPDVLDELDRCLAAAPRASHRRPMLLVVRRDRNILNSHAAAGPRARPFNVVSLHPADAHRLGLAENDPITVQADFAGIPAVVDLYATLREGVASMIHCRGGLPEETDRYDAIGVSTSLLVRTDGELEAINFMPVMTAIPVSIEPRDTAAHTPRSAARLS